jgi:beta-glucosidase
MNMKLSAIGFFAVASLALSHAGIKGIVIDESGAPIKDATVTVRALPNLLSSARTLSDEKGAFDFDKAKLNAASKKTLKKKGQSLIVRKTGFLPETLSVAPNKNYGNITLKRDPIENRIDELMASMTIDDMIAQMTQAKAPNTTCGGKLCGSALEGGGAYTADFYTKAWKHKIPVTYGKDNVHGVADVTNATIFPHNIGLGATRDSALVRKIGQVVAEEMWAAHIDLNFAPAITVPQDERWGRVYEGFGETTELAVDLGAAFVRGQQGDKNDAEWRVITTLKHFIGDGATDNGFDRGNATLTDKDIYEKYLPPYEAAIEQGSMSVMASFNQINGVHQHVDSARLTGILKTELGFDGYVIADWEGIESSTTPGAAGDYSPGLVTGISSKDAIRNAINAGIDLAMVPQSAEAFVRNMKELVASGAISEERVKDATRRILRAKIRAGRIDNPNGPAAYVGKTENIGSAAHRQIAREAVQKSLVVLKNKKTLPLSTNGKIFVTGSHANNTGLQCGAWTKSWQGGTSEIPGATSIQAGFDEVAQGTRVATAEEAGTIVYVIGETPYAEWFGDFRGEDFNNKIINKTDGKVAFRTTDSDIDQIKTWKAAGHKVVVVLITGRPLPITSLINAADAFVVAWLPGSEGAGVADVLFGKVKPTGKLPHTWPKDAKQIPINVGDGKKGLFPYGFGLTY